MLTALILAACAAPPSAPKKVALLAPFENQYREIGYNALYALRLALDDAGSDTQLLALDDGGTVKLATARVDAFNRDPAAAAIIALGPHATHANVQKASQLPMLIVGNWGNSRAAANTFYVANQELTQAAKADDLLALEQARALRDDLDGRDFRSSGSPLSENFRERYLASDLYVPQPNLLATLVYDVAGLVFAALESKLPISQAAHTGINGLIQFQDGYWQGAPVHSYTIVAGEVVKSAPSTTP
ncbi:MAG: hypothetical protein OXI62_01490 [Chloroflexota bacterium]|nr:hypothetical protein [Chloroflexota bacterium]MDE2649378.1 hypothetical protein [Chloroflexota bacterium]MXX82694.1 hypothetical protein [Chloroflexota bacterium]MYC55795.1 hypothetical protein [Chloroflexota bacterium]MYH64123.1 hypothetical protein [Chloroflexota bacterium]